MRSALRRGLARPLPSSLRPGAGGGKPLPYRARRRPGASRAAVTLIELLVSMSIFTLLGLSLIVILRGGLTTWRRSEARGVSFEAGQAVLGQMREDLLSVVPPFDTPLEGTGPVEARFLCDVSPDHGLPRLFLVRSIKAETEHPITGLAGSTIGGDAVFDYRGDLAEARQGRLRATGGAMEVAWVLGADGILYRGVRSPVGPPNSLFSNADPYELAPPPGEPGAPDPGAAPDPDAPALLRPFATDVAYVGYRFWTQYTTSWDLAHPCRRVLHQGEESGPLDYWDSTRAMLAPVDPSDPRRFETFRRRDSLDDPRDDIIPAKVRVTLVLREPPQAGSSTFLSAAIDADDRSFRVDEPGRLDPEGGFVKIDQEWIQYESVRGDEVVVPSDGRGARGTLPAPHGGPDDDLEVIVGRTFVAIFSVPAWREDWGDNAWEAAR